jgi:hypothetical protein
MQTMHNNEKEVMVYTGMQIIYMLFKGDTTSAACPDCMTRSGVGFGVTVQMAQKLDSNLLFDFSWSHQTMGLWTQRAFSIHCQLMAHDQLYPYWGSESANCTRGFTHSSRDGTHSSRPKSSSIWSNRFSASESRPKLINWIPT